MKIFYKKRNNSGPDSGDRAGFWLSYAAFLVIAGTVLLFCMILAAALPAFFEPGPGSPFGWTWQPYQGSFGILPMCLGSLALASFALILGWPLALSVCGFLLTEESPSLRPFRKASSVLVRFMTTIPTVVYGFAAVFLLTPLIRRAFGGSGMCLLAAGLILTLEILPTMVLVMLAGLGPRLSRLCPWGQALGFSRLGLFRLFVLPRSRRTLAAAAVLGFGRAAGDTLIPLMLAAAAVLGFGRAAGDTLIPLMLAGNAVQVPQGLLSSIRTLTAHMALVTSNEVGGAAYGSLFCAGLILLVVNAGASITLHALEKKRGKDE